MMKCVYMIGIEMQKMFQQRNIIFVKYDKYYVKIINIDIYRKGI